MKKECLPHLPVTLAKSFNALFHKDFKLFQVSNNTQLGCRLLDLALYSLSSQQKLRILITNSSVLESFKMRADNVGIEIMVNSPGRLYLEWSKEIYPSQKTLAVDNVYSKLNQKVGSQSKYSILVKSQLNRALPRSETVESSQFSHDLMHQVRLAKSLYNPLVNYHLLKQLTADDLNQDILQQEVNEIRKLIDKVLEVLSIIDESNYDIGSLRRMNHTSTNALVSTLYSAYRKAENTIKSLTQIKIDELKQPMNASTLTSHLKAKVVEWNHFIELLSNQQVVEWLGVVKGLPWDIADSLWNYAQYKITQPWMDVLLFERVNQDLGDIDFKSSRMKFVDCQHLLRVQTGSIKERIEILLNESLFNSEDQSLTLVPDYLSGSAINPLRYEAVSTMDSLPLHSEIYTGTINDSQFLSNSKTISRLLTNCVPNLDVYLSKSKIIISTLHYFSSEVSNTLIQSGFEKLQKSNTNEMLEQCLVDNSRQVYLLILGSLLSVEDISDWVYQIQLLEAFEDSGIRIIDVPVHMNKGNKCALPKTISSLLEDYVES